jgi:hypothetical protein
VTWEGKTGLLYATELASLLCCRRIVSRPVSPGGAGFVWWDGFFLFVRFLQTAWAGLNALISTDQLRLRVRIDQDLREVLSRHGSGFGGPLAHTYPMAEAMTLEKSH